MESSYLKIFRPWDLGSKKQEQDCTITTTSFEDDSDSKSSSNILKQESVINPVKNQSISDFEKTQKSKGTIRKITSKSSLVTKNHKGTPPSSRKSVETHEKYDCLSSSEACDSPIENYTFNFGPIQKIPKGHNNTYPNTYFPSEILGLPTPKVPENSTSPNLSKSDDKHCGKTKEKIKISDNSANFSQRDILKDPKGYLSAPKLQGFCPETILYPDIPLGMDYHMYPEMLQANLAQSLGLNPQDPLFMESITQGYAMEEYARIMTQEQQAKYLQGKKQRPKKYKCPHCDVGFSNNGQLKGHVRIHTGERPFKCEEENCGKTFTRNEELTRHKRIHSGLRPYPCQQCGKRFGRKDHLKKHTRTHFQNRGMLAVPIMLPLEAWTNSSYPYVPLYGY